MSKRYKGGIISATAPTTSSSAATGIWTLEQQMQAKGQSLWPAVIPVVGSALGGGFFAGQISTAGNGIADYNLVVGPVASAQSTLNWKIVATSTSGTSSVINGPANSSAMNDATHPAAQFCEAVTAGGFTDWYMPAKNELEVCYFNLKPTTAVNITNSGINPNSVPARASNYTSGNPVQTTAAAFVTSTGTEAFSSGSYWSSTEATATGAWMQQFNQGYQYILAKNYSYRVRAIRRVAV